MSWRDRFVQAEFRGVKFLTQQSEVQIGQRRALYEIPNSDRGAIGIPLGRTPRKFKLSALLVGADYDTDRDRLIKALEDPTPGLLVHPFLGTVTVHAGSEISITESPNNGGVCVIAFDAVEAYDTVAATALNETQSRKAGVQAHAANLEAANRKAFGDSFRAVDTFGNVRNAAVADVDLALNTLRSVNGTVTATLTTPSTIAHEIDLAAQETVLLIGQPQDLYDTLANTIRSVSESGQKVANAITGTDDTETTPPVVAARSLALMQDSWDLMAGVPEIPDVETLQRQRQRANRAAMRHALRHTTLATLANTFAVTTFPSQDAAEAAYEALRDALTASILDPIYGYDVDADVVAANQDLAAALRAHLDTLHLARVVDYTPAGPIPAVVLAYALYGDADRSEEILGLNDVANPVFLPGGETLQVLSV